jgi:hypothetical protein
VDDTLIAVFDGMPEVLGAVFAPKMLHACAMQIACNSIDDTNLTARKLRPRAVKPYPLAPLA